LRFVGKELYTNQKAPGSSTYEPLDELTDDEARIFRSHTNAFPFTDVNGAYSLVGASFEIDVLVGLTAAQIGNEMNRKASPVAGAVDGAANVITAAICETTGGQPGSVCAAPGVVAAAKTLPL
jgi:hypothetical protein